MYRTSIYNILPLTAQNIITREEFLKLNLYLPCTNTYIHIEIGSSNNSI